MCLGRARTPDEGVRETLSLCPLSLCAPAPREKESVFVAQMRASSDGGKLPSATLANPSLWLFALSPAADYDLSPHGRSISVLALRYSSDCYAIVAIARLQSRLHCLVDCKFGYA